MLSGSEASQSGPIEEHVMLSAHRSKGSACSRSMGQTEMRRAKHGMGTSLLTMSLINAFTS